MSKKLGIPLGLLLLALLGGAFWQALRQPALVYQGKPLAFWLKGFDIGYNDPRKPSFDESVEAVRQAGTNVLPALLRMLRTRDSDLKHRLTRLAQKQRLIKIGYVSADRQRWAARLGFAALSFYPKSAIPQLVEISQEETSRAEWNKYATEILDILKQMWGKDVSEDIAKAQKKKDRSATAKAGSQ